MGKNWRGGKRGGGKENSGGGTSHGRHDLPSCRGNSIVLCTCDVAREREASKELVNLITEAIEICYPHIQNASSENKQDASGEPCASSSGATGTAQDMLSKELDELRNINRKGKQMVVSVYTGVKGIILAKITNDAVCPVKIVKSIFEKVANDRMPCSRHLVRMIPLQRVFYPNIEELTENVRSLLISEGIGVSKEAKPHPTESSSVSEVPLSGVKRQAEDENNGFDENQKLMESNKKTKQDGDGVLSGPSNHLVENAAKNECTASGETVVASSDERKDSAAEEDVAALDPSTNPTAHSPSNPFDPVSSSTHGIKALSDHQSSSCEPESSSPASGTYIVQFKSRNHNTLNRHSVQRLVREQMPYTMRTNFTEPQYTLIVEALMNIGGICLITDYSKVLELNLRKYQQLHSSANESSHGKGMEEKGLHVDKDDVHNEGS